VASLYKKVINGKPYWYLREMGWVDGKPKMVSERYLGSAPTSPPRWTPGGGDPTRADPAPRVRRRRRRLGMLERLGVIALIDEVVGARRRDAGASVGTYLALAALGRLVDPCSKLGFEKWWRTTAADRFTKIGAGVLDHRKFWTRCTGSATSNWPGSSTGWPWAWSRRSVWTSPRWPGHDQLRHLHRYHQRPRADRSARQGQTETSRPAPDRARLVITRDGGIPLVSHAYPGNRPDVTQFAAMIELLVARHTALAAALRPDPGDPDAATPAAMAPTQVTVVFDAGQNSAANLAHLDAAGLGFVGSIPPSDCPDLLARPATDRHVVDSDRFPGVTALEDRRHVFGADRRVVLTHSQTLHTAQSRGFEQTLAKATAKLSALGDTLARATPDGPATRSPPRSPRSSRTPGCAGSCPASSPATPPPSTGSASTSTRPPAPIWRPRSSANAC